jgi:hypothetical protein
MLLILLGVFLTAFLLSVSTLMIKEGLIFGDAVKVIACSYSRVGSALLQGRWNVSSSLMTVQCMSDKI